uniref:p-glycoprotein n=1 Tax=Panagrolaimus sp. ES5 TaxID=591445 RepID=A0AC34FTU9_9BILA
SAQTINKNNEIDVESEGDYESAEDELFVRGIRKSESESADEIERKKRESIRISKSIANVGYEIVEDLNLTKAKISTTFCDIFKYAKPEQRYLISGLICSILTGFRYPILAALMGLFFAVLAKLPEGEGMDEAFWIALAFLALAVVSCLTTYFSGFFLGSAGEKMASRLRMSVFTNIMHQDGYYFDQTTHSVGKLTSRLASDAHHVQGAIDQRLAEVLVGLSSLISGILLCIWWGPFVTAVCLIASIIFVTFKIAMSNYLKKRGLQDLQSAEECARIASEGIENVKTIQALAKQDNIYANFCAASAIPHRRALIRGYFQSSIYSSGLCFAGFNFAISYSIGIFLVRDRYTTPQILFQVSETLTVAAIVIIAAATYFPEYLRARLSAQIMFDMINEKPKINAMDQNGQKLPINGNIDLKNVTFSYPNGSTKHLTLNNLSLSVLQGKNIALVGPSGSGKSTVVQLMERFYDIFSGTISIDKTDIRHLNVPWLRNASSVVGQEPTLFNLTIRENISYGMKEVSIEKIIEAAKLANIHEFIESLPEKYETNIGNKGTQLSGGQRQRIAIARAIIRDPKILLLDEATSALDTESERIVQEALERASEGRTCLTIAHRLSTIQNADIIVVIRDGKVVEYGNHQQLLSQKGLYNRMVQKQHMD